MKRENHAQTSYSEHGRCAKIKWKTCRQGVQSVQKRLCSLNYFICGVFVAVAVVFSI